MVSLLNTSTTIAPTQTFSLFNFWFEPSPFNKTLVYCQTRPRLLIFHSTISLPHKKFLFRKILMTSFPEVESRTQGSRPRPRTQKNPRPRTAFPRTDTLEAKDRNARGQGQGPRTQAQVLSKKKKVFTKIFQAFSKKKKKKKVFTKIFQAISTKTRFPKNSSSRGQANFRGLEASRPRPRTSKCVLEDSTSGSFHASPA